MESAEATIAGSTAGRMIGANFSSQIGGEIHQLMSAAPPTETGSSFTALLELPANQAVELLVHSPEDAVENPSVPLAAAQFHECPLPPPDALAVFPSEAVALVDRASKFSGKLEIVKQEPLESVSNPNSNPSPAVSNPAVDQNPKTTKRKDREKKGKESNKKSKKPANESSDDGSGEKLPYVHVRARRGQATNSHSLAERARREKINARMKLLQELVPGCNKISGTAMVLDEIINHVQSLQRQVEFLSMRLATVNPRVDFDIDALIATENGSPVEMGYPGMVVPAMWSEGQVHVNSQQYQQLCHMDELHQPVWVREEDNSNFFTSENSLLRYDSSASLHSNQLKMEL